MGNVWETITATTVAPAGGAVPYRSAETSGAVAAGGPVARLG